MKNRKKVSEELFSDVSTRLEELQFLFTEKSVTTVFGDSEKGYFLLH